MEQILKFRWYQFFIIFLVFICFVGIGYLFHKQSQQPRFVTISIPKVIDSQMKKFDKKIQNATSLPDETQIQKDIEKYTLMIAKTIEEYTKKRNIIVFEKGSIVSSGIYIEDMTDDFIKAISE